MKFRYLFFSALISAVLLARAQAQSNSVFAKANQDYAAGNFHAAIEQYETLMHDGQTSANLFYDLGNAYFRVSDFGRAILNYQRALALEPEHAEATANLRLVRDEARALELKKTRPEQLSGFATPTQFTIAGTIAFWLTLFAIAAAFFAQRRGRLFAVATCCAIICAVSVFAVVAHEKGNSGSALAIVTVKNIQARVAVADNSNSVLLLPPGSEIKILSTRGDWIYAALPNDLRGWIPSAGAELVRL